MTMKKKSLLAFAFVLCLAVVFSSCAQRKAVVKQDETATEKSVDKKPATPSSVEVREPISGSDVEGMGQDDVSVTPGAAVSETFDDVHFDYDQYGIRKSDEPTLNRLGTWLIRNPSARVTIEGHCDDRGTPEYNLALGERRANAVKDYLAASGVDRGRITTISYGEERPLDPGTGEAAWARNRRGHFSVSK